MINNKTIAVVVKAYNEEKQIEMVINELPEFVDKIIIVNDCSKDNTQNTVEKIIRSLPITGKTFEKKIKIQSRYTYADKVVSEMREIESKRFVNHEIFEIADRRVILINLTENSGAGATVSVGYKWCRENEIDCTVVIDGDGQVPLESVAEVYDTIKMTDYDIVKTYRHKRHDGIYRTILSSTYNLIFKILYPGLNSKDVNSKPKILTKEVYYKLNLQSTDWFIDA